MSTFRNRMNEPSQRRILAVLAGLTLAAALGLRLFRLGWPDLVGGDEGYYGTYARNILIGGWEQLVNLGREPLSAPDNKPFLFPLLLSLAIRAFGPTELALRLVSALAGLATALCVAGIVRRAHGRTAAAAAALMTLSLPPLVYGSRVVMGEPLLTAFGLAGAWAALRSIEERRTAGFLLAGALWGLGFLVKLWLVGLFIAPVGLALLADRRRRADPGLWGRFLLSAIPFLLVGGCHLLMVWWTSPETLRHWLDQYFIFSLFGRAAGGDFAAYWHQSWSYYLRTTLQTCFPLLPLALAGLLASGADAPEKLSQRLFWGGLLLELLLISKMQVKLRQYSFPLLPALGAMAGVGAWQLLQGGIAPAGRRWAALLTLAVLLPLAIWQTGDEPLFPSGKLALLAGAFLTFAAGAMALPAVGGAVPMLLVGASVAAALAGSGLTVQRECLRHRTGYREAAAMLEPLLRDVDPRQAVFLAPEVPSLQFYLFRTGQYWSSPYEPRTPEQLLELCAKPGMRAFVTTSSLELYGGATPAEAVHWLEANTRELTDELRRQAGAELPIRLFVKAAPEPSP